MKNEKNLTHRPLSEHVFHPNSFMVGDCDPTILHDDIPEILRRVYSFDSSFVGEGVRIAIVCALDDVALQQNMDVFCQRFGLEKTGISVFYPFGRTEDTSDGWLLESSLDTQWIYVFAPKAKMNVVFSKDSSVTSLLDAAEYAQKTLSADIICMCFGTDESASDGVLSGFMNDGKIFVSSSGDVGGSVSFPSSSPCCISVGGTDLSTLSGKRYSETAWKNTGGGKSDVFDIPFYQGRFFNIYGKSLGMRGTPDVSMCANYSAGVPVYVSQLGGWKMVSGTSLSASCFAGICACIKQKHPEIVTSEDMLSYLYNKAGGDGYAFPQYDFYDITVGRSGENYAERGWDFATGLGSPVIRQLLL